MSIEGDLRDALAANREQAVELSGTTGRRALLRVLRAAEGELARRLHQAPGLRGVGSAETFTEARMLSTLAQVREVSRGLQEALGGVVEDAGGQAAGAAAGDVLGYLAAAERAFRGAGSVLPVREAMMLDAASQGAKASLLRRLAGEGDAGVLGRYGVATVAHFERTLQVGLAAGLPTSEVRAQLIEGSPFLQGAPAHWAERIVRSEVHGAYARAAHGAMRSAQRQLGDVVRVVTATFDDRTGADSWNVHGQVRRVAEAFEYVRGDGGRELFLTPPNRPNDREVVVVHRLSWGPVPPGLRPKGTGEVQARYARDGARFHGRPSPMSTVPQLR